MLNTTIMFMQKCYVTRRCYWTAYFSYFRTDDMVDVLNQLPDVIGNGRQVVQRITTIGLRAVTAEAQRLRIINREQEKQVNTN